MAKEKITRMRQERIENEWSQRYVGETVGVTKQAIQQIETLKNNPSLKVIVALEKLFGLPYHELLEVGEWQASFSKE